MKILFVNKFLYPNGGSETYMFSLGGYLASLGHTVRYFGMADGRNITANPPGDDVRNIDFHRGGPAKLAYPFKVIYSREAYKKITKVIGDFSPDVVHMNNINFQLTPSIIHAVKTLGVPLIQTVHDAQMVCPNHKLYIEGTGVVCEECITKGPWGCFKNRCLHNSRMRSLIASAEGAYYRKRGTYALIGRMICPSQFLAGKLIKGGIDGSRITVLHNFTERAANPPARAGEPYVLYFGRLAREKGIDTLLTVCRMLPHIPFVVAGRGPLEGQLQGVENIRFLGFQEKGSLPGLIANAAMSVLPSQWYENCPVSILESQAYGTPVIASDRGGSVELIDNEKTGLIFPADEPGALARCIERLWNDTALLDTMRQNCLQKQTLTIEQYAQTLLTIYTALIQNKKDGAHAKA